LKNYIVMDKLQFFTNQQGALLIQLFLAHIISDFILQTKTMVSNKKWLSIDMLLHIVIVYMSTALCTGLWLPAIIIAVIHYIIDGFKVSATNKKWGTELKLFIIDQALHLITILGIWAWHCDLFGKLGIVARLPLTNYTISLIVLGYFIIIWPVAYIIDFALQLMVKDNIDNNENIGKLIGMFERIIILTFVLLGQYEAIGFLITGKSILRFAGTNETSKSEYVLLGTMLSYGICIIFGIVLKWLLHF
jgi:hypothetical protein